jgi:WD40 repeat protein
VGRLASERVQTLRLPGLSVAAGQQMLGLAGADPVAKIVSHYAGNPLALKIVAAGLRDLLGNDVSMFLTLLEQGSFWFGDIQDLLERHCDRLSPPEQELIYWLAIAREPIALPALQQALLSPASQGQLPETLASLQRRSVIEVTPTGLTLQPAVMEYVTNRFLEKACGELLIALSAPAALSESAALLRHHPLLQASAQDYIRAAQRRWLVEPAIAQLQGQLDLGPALALLLARQRRQPTRKTGYLGGNLVNLLSALQAPGHTQFERCDWQDLTLWQADLRSVQLHQVNLSRSDLTGAAFTETFSTVLSAAFSPDGQQLAHSDDRGWVYLWTVATGQPVRAFQAHQNWIFAVAWSPDGQVLACGSLDRSVSLWPVSSPVHKADSPLHRWIYHAEGVSSLAFHPQATATSGLLASGSTDQTVRLVDLATGDCVHTLTGHQGIVRAIAFSPDGGFLVSGGMDQRVGIWTPDGAAWQPHWLSAATAIYAVAVLPDRTIAAAGEDGRIRLWNPQGELLRVLEGHTDRVWSLTTDAGRLISGGDDRMIKIWNGDGDCLATLGGHQNRIWTLAVAGRKLASGGEDKTLRIWDADRHYPLHTLQGYHNATAPVAFQDGALYTLSADQVLRRWILDAAASRWIADRTLRLPTQGAFQAAMAGDIVASGSLNGQIHLLNYRTGQRLHQLDGHRTWVRSVTFSPDGQILASAGGDGTVGLWDVATGQRLQMWAAHQSPVQAVAFSPDGQRLASGSWDRTVKLWEIQTGAQATCVQTWAGHADRITALLFSNDGTTLLSASQDGTIRQWDLGTPIGPILNHGSPVVAMARYDHVLASTSQDGTLRLWDWQSGDCLQSMPSGLDRWPEALGWPTQVIFSPDGQTLCVGGTNGTSWIWDRSGRPTGGPLLVQVPRPYELTNITGVQGLSDAQRASLIALGAIVDS